MKKETASLNSELLPYLIKGEAFTMLRHPLVYGVPYFEQMNDYYNQQLAYKTKATEKALKARDFERYVFLHERPYRLQGFLDYKAKVRVPDSEYWRVLGNVWSDSENIWQNLGVWKQVLQSNRSMRECFMDSEDLEAFNKLPGSIKIYRGCQHNVNEHGLSWSTDQNKAAWFARRYKSPRPVLLSAEVDKKDAFAYITGRNESEVVVIKARKFLHNLKKEDL